MSEKSVFTQTLEQVSGTMEKGTTFAGRYRILGELGTGGMGQVFKVFDTQIDEEVALKVLKDGIASNPHVLERFCNELKYARKITHKSVCRMFDINQTGGTTYITMEFVEGEDLKSVIRRKGKLGIGQSIGVALQIMDGLYEAHDLGIVHRDLKPQNIMIDPEGNAKIMDFGIARSTKTEGVTQEGTIIGTPEYMSPEQVMGKPVDQRSDIYSLGIILFEMLTGQVPFSGNTALDIAVKHKTAEPEDPREHNNKIPAELADLILRSMAKDPTDRFQNVGEFLKSLVSIEENLPTSERSAQKVVPRVDKRKTTMSSLKKALIPTIAIAAVIVLGLIAWRFIFPPSRADLASGKPIVAVLQFKNNTGDPTYDGEWRAMLADSLTTDLMQSKFLHMVTQPRVYSFLMRKNLLDARNYTSEDLRKFAEEVRATYFIQGSISKSGQLFQLSATLMDAKDMESIGAAESSLRRIDDYASMVDELTKNMKPYFGLTDEDISSDLDVNIGDATTKSPKAHQFYLQAEKARQNMKFHEARDLMEKALALDPDFAEGYRFMARIHNALEISYGESTLDKVREYHQAAYDAMHRKAEQGNPVTKRERLIIEASYHTWVERDARKVLDSYAELLRLYPHDSLGNHMMGVHSEQRFKDYAKSAEHLETVIRWGEPAVNDYGPLGKLYTDLQEYDKARSILLEGIERFPDDRSLRFVLMRSYTLNAQYEQALVEFENMYLVDPLSIYNHKARGDVFFYKEDYQEAEVEYRKCLERENNNDRILGWEWLINLSFLQGRLSEMLNLIDLAEKDTGHDFSWVRMDVAMAKGNWDEADKINANWIPTNNRIRNFPRAYRLAILDTRLKRWDKAQEFVDKWSRWLEDPNNINLKRNWTVLDVQGRIELERGNFSLAIEKLEQAKELVPSIHDLDYALYIEALARAYFESGGYKRAKEEYELISTLSEGRYWYGDIYVKSFYMLGTIAEEMGKKKEAKKHCARFLDLWKNADPDITELIDAKKRVANLQ